MIKILAHTQEQKINIVHFFFFYLFLLLKSCVFLVRNQASFQFLVLINLLLCGKGKKADEENPEGSNVCPKSRYDVEECNFSKCVLIAKEYCIDWA